MWRFFMLSLQGAATGKALATFLHEVLEELTAHSEKVPGEKVERLNALPIPRRGQQSYSQASKKRDRDLRGVLMREEQFTFTL